LSSGVDGNELIADLNVSDSAVDGVAELGLGAIGDTTKRSTGNTLTETGLDVVEQAGGLAQLAGETANLTGQATELTTSSAELTSKTAELTGETAKLTSKTSHGTIASNSIQDSLHGVAAWETAHDPTKTS
jgi:hypothetical protein